MKGHHDGEVCVGVGGRGRVGEGVLGLEVCDAPEGGNGKRNRVLGGEDLLGI